MSVRSDRDSLPPTWDWSTAHALQVEVFDCPHSTPKLVADGPLVARTQDIASGVFRPESAARVSTATYRQRVVRAEPRYGDLMYSREGAYFGVAAEVPPSTPVCLGQRMVLIRTQPEVLDHRFLKGWLNSPTALAHARSHTEGSAAPRINLPTIRTFPVPVPPVAEQRGIAMTLGALDEKIESNRRIVDLSMDLLDSFAVEFAAAERAIVPLGELVNVSRESIDPAGLGEELVDHFSIPAFDVAAWPDRVEASSIMSNKLLVRRDSILVSRLNPRFNRTWWCVPTDGSRALASTEFLVVSTADPNDLGALWLTLRDEYFMTELTRRVTGTSGSHQRVRPDDALAIEVPDLRLLPPEGKERALGLLTLIHQRRSENRHLLGLRDVLLPELYSGRLRVPEAGASVSEAIP